MNRNNKITFTIYKSRCAILLLSVTVLTVMIEPTYISTVVSGWVHVLYRVLKYVIALLVLIALFLRRIKLDMLMIGMVVFEGCLFISTFIREGDLYTWIRNGAYCIILLLFMQIIVSIIPDIAFAAVSIVLGLYVHINTLTWILYPEGLYVDRIAGYKNCWLLGYDNCAAPIIILAEIVAVYRLVSKHKSSQIWNWSILISGSVFIFSQMIATAIITEVTVIIFLFLTKRKDVRKVIGNGKIIVIGMMILFILIQFFNIQGASIFSMIFRLLGKNATFGRTRLWQMAWGDILPKNIVLGLGVQTSETYIAHFGQRFCSHLHCYYLQVLYEGGLLAFGSFVSLLLQVAGKFDKGEKDFSDMVLLSGLLAFMLMWQVEAYSGLVWYFFILLDLLYDASAFKKTENTNVPVDIISNKMG